ncbi:CD1375 family protein [Alkaliphilus crotonatoxidans]
MVAVYVSLIQKGLRTLEQIPSLWKDAVAEAIKQ